MLGKRIYIQEVAPRDGFQIEKTFIPTEQKVVLIDELSRTGLAKIEVTSFVSSKAVPNLRDAEEVMNNIIRSEDIVYVVLVPNAKGAERAIASSADEINLVMSASETHNLANVNRNHERSLDEFAEILNMVKGEHITVNGTIATSFGCPFEGTIPGETVLKIVDSYLEIGMDSITLADTTGMATPKHVKQLASQVRKRWPNLEITLHFHNTRGMGLANILAGIEAGIVRFDTSLGGLGGCPFAPGATGNVCTEDVVHMLQFMDYETGVDLDRVLEIAKRLPDIVGHEIDGQVVKAGKITDLHPIPLRGNKHAKSNA